MSPKDNDTVEVTATKKINLTRPGVADGPSPSVKESKPLDERVRRREVLEDGTIVETY